MKRIYTTLFRHVRGISKSKRTKRNNNKFFSSIRDVEKCPHFKNLLIIFLRQEYIIIKEFMSTIRTNFLFEFRLQLLITVLPISLVFDGISGR